MRKIKNVLTLAILSLIMCITATGCQFIQNNNTGHLGHLGNSTTASSQVEFAEINSNERAEMTLVNAVKKVERTSVAIQTDSGSGSGVILDVVDTGKIVYIVTCHHVISGGGNVTVKLPDENCSYDNQDYIFTGTIGSQIYDTAVTLVGGDSVSDIAVLKIDLNKKAMSNKNLDLSKVQKAVLPSEEYELKKGESIFAIGNPTGQLPGSVADGIVSYVNRTITVSEVGYMDVMQISVATNPGNSGGGLYNLYGELIGITNAGNTNYDEINFAIPLENTKDTGFRTIVSQLIATATATNYGYITDRWNLGIVVQGQTNSFGNSYIVVQEVVSGSNFALAGVKVGDIITALSFNGQNYSVTALNFADCVGLMKTSLRKNDSFKVFVARGYNQNLELLVNITVADYIFCDTGN